MALTLNVICSVPPVLLTVPTAVVPTRTFAPLRLTPALPLPVVPNTSLTLAPPSRCRVSTAPCHLPLAPKQIELRV